MRAYKLEILIIDHDNVGAEGIERELRNANYGNDCITPHVQRIQSVDIGEWSDDHPLNKRATCDEEYARLFPK